MSRQLLLPTHQGLTVQVTLPGKQFEVGRRLRSLAVTALRREGIATAAWSPVDMLNQCRW